MSTQLDALSLLRHFIMNKKEFIQDGDKIIFGDVFYPKDTKTNYIIYDPDKKNQKDYYTLESIVYLVKNIHLAHASYIKNASTQNIPCVNRVDRKDLYAYLSGEIEPNANVDKNAPLEITVQNPIPLSKLPKRSNQQDFIQDSKRLKTNDDLLSNSANITQIRERIAKRDTGNKTTHITENIPSELSSVLPIEKITSIKAKFLAKNRDKIRTNENDEELIQQSGSKINDVVDDVTKEILNRERVWRNRRTILESNVKRFDTNIFAILQSIKTKEETTIQQSSFNSDSIGLKNNVNDITSLSSKQISSSQPTQNPLSQSQQNLKSRALNYSRFDQERYGPKDDTGGFSIDTKRSYQLNGAISLNDNSSSQPIMSQLNTQKIPQQIISNKSVLSSSQTSSTSSSQKRQVMRPIIVVPASRTSIITLFNCVDILQDLKYVSSEEKRKNIQNVKDSEIIMRRKDDGKTMQFKVIDNVSKLNNEDWDRVIAVFAQGPSWQFKDWPWDGNPIDIFNKVKAFHLKWSGINLESNISKWSVTVVELDQNKRHLDRARLLMIWDELDKFMVKNKPHLCT